MTSRLPAAARMGLVELAVADLQRQLAFYRDVLGVPVRGERAGAVELGADETLLRLREEPGASPRPPRTSGLHHVALLLPRREDLGRAIAHLIAQRWPLDGASDHLVSEALYLSDPEGNGLEIYADRPRERWTFDGPGRLHMATEPMDVDAVLAAGADRPWRGLPAGSRVGHVHLNVGDVAAAEAFYDTALGFDVTARLPGSASFLSAGGYHHHVAVNSWTGRGAPPPPPDAAGLRELTLLLPDRRALDEVAIRLPGAAESDRALLVADPSGNRVRVRAA